MDNLYTYHSAQLMVNVSSKIPPLGNMAVTFVNSRKNCLMWNDDKRNKLCAAYQRLKRAKDVQYSIS